MDKVGERQRGRGNKNAQSAFLFSSSREAPFAVLFCKRTGQLRSSFLTHKKVAIIKNSYRNPDKRQLLLID